MKATHCPSCNKWVPADRVECLGCGHRITSAPVTTDSLAVSPDNSKAMYIGFSVVTIITILILIMFIGRQRRYENDSDKHLKNAKAILASSSISNDDLKLAEDYLYKVDKRSSSYKEAEKILPEVRAKVNTLNFKKEHEEKNKQVQKINHAPGVTPSQRVGFAQSYENEKLSEGVDATITALGKNKATLKISYVLMNKATAYQMINNKDNTFVWSRAGFTTIIFANGYGGEWSYCVFRPKPTGIPA